MKSEFPHASETFKKINPAIFGSNPPARLHPDKPESNGRGKGEDCGVVEVQKSVSYRVTFIVRRPRLLDNGDNDRASLKPLRDRVSSLLGFRSDDEPNLGWVYFQIKDRAKSTTVIIEILK